MDFGLREWLLILGPLLIMVILVHGYLRMRSNRNTLKMALDKSFIGSEPVRPDEDLSLLRGELPNGGARVRKIPEQGALDLQEEIPVLMEPVELGQEDRESEVDEPTSQPVEETDSIENGQPVPGPKPEHFVVLYVTATGEPFHGQALLEALVELDMQFGEMDIFHRPGGNGRPLFSLVNAIEPGTFEIASMDRLRTPAVSLFMRAHELDAPVEVFDEMVSFAQALADELGGEVKDDSRSVLTPQTIEHCREEIRAYQHRCR